MGKKNKGKANKFRYNRFPLPNNSTMIIIYHFGVNIQQYAKLGRENIFPSIYGCKNCPYEGKLYRHGFYERGVITPSAYYRIPVLRLKCPVCGKTYSVMPDWLIPYFQYCYAIILYTLISALLKQWSFSRIVSAFNKAPCYMSIQSVSAYVKRFKLSYRQIHSFFMQLQYYYADNMDINAFLPCCACCKVASGIQSFEKTYKRFNVSFYNHMPCYFFAPVR